MSKYRATYKCPICDKLIAGAKVHEFEYEQLPKLLTKFIQNQQFVGNPYLYEAPMYMIHLCSNGGGGLAFFAGFIPEENAVLLKLQDCGLLYRILLKLKKLGLF